MNNIEIIQKMDMIIVLMTEKLKEYFQRDKIEYEELEDEKNMFKKDCSDIYDKHFNENLNMNSEEMIKIVEWRNYEFKELFIDDRWNYRY